MYKIITFLFFVASTCYVVAQENTIKPGFEFLQKFNNIRDLSISKNQNEIFFTIQNTNDDIALIAYSKKENNIWHKPQLVNFSGKHRDIEPFLSEDGLKLYFSSNRPLHDSISLSKDYDIWVVERTNLNSEWQKPKNIGTPINTPNNEFYPSLAQNGNLYYTSDGSKSLGKDDIYVSKWSNNSYAEPSNLGVNINTAGYEFNAFIAPNEQFIIFTAYNRPDGLGSGDLFISYKDKNGSWDKATNMGAAINSSQMDYCPFYDIKSETLYFTSKRNMTKNSGFKTIEEFEKEITKYENGCSRIYKYKMKL